MTIRCYKAILHCVLTSSLTFRQIIGAPAFFPTVWGWIKRWFDPITVSKIFILSNSNMKSTLEKYIDSGNIPKKYGGQLDFQFGQMPELEPAILRSVKWSSESAQSSPQALPTGPILWRETADGGMEAVAVGSVNGKPRQERIAIMNPSQRGEATSKPLDVPVKTNSNVATNDSTPSEIYRTTTGEHTHPLRETAADTELNKDEPPRDSTDEGNGAIPLEKAKIPDTSRRGTYTVPVQSRDGISSPLLPSGEDAKSNSRQGTSETRFEQQSSTHADGTLAEGTPDVRDHGHSDKSSTMEPKTVGQAPKEVPRPETEKNTGDGEGYVAKAQAAASSAYQEAGRLVGEAEKAVTGAVGMGKAEEKKAEAAPKPEVDPTVDGLKETHVEEYLRSTAGSQSPPASGK